MTDAQTEGRAIADPYLRIVDFFDRDETAGAFLREDGDGGFTGAAYRMAREIDALREVLAAKDAELARRDMQLEASAKVALDLSAQLAEARKALTLIDALDPEGHSAGCSSDALRGLVSRMGEIARTTLKELGD